MVSVFGIVILVWGIYLLPFRYLDPYGDGRCRLNLEVPPLSSTALEILIVLTATTTDLRRFRKGCSICPVKVISSLPLVGCVCELRGWEACRAPRSYQERII